jgi:GNAT superfamily N-acetyltransferase
MSLVLRPAEAADLEPLVALWRGFMEFHAAYDSAFALGVGAEEIRRQFLAPRFTEPDTFVLIALAEGEAIGYAMGDVQGRPPVFAATRFGHISDLYVVPGRQRAGVGGHMLQESLAWFRVREVQRIEVRTLTSNPISNAFWAKQGFRPFAQESFLPLEG